MDSPTDTLPVTSRVSVEEAKEQFAELERQLSRISLRKESSSEVDPEKGASEGGFNLREYLISQNAAQDEAGITNHHKRVGVSWKDLEVIVTSSSDSKVCLYRIHSLIMTDVDQEICRNIRKYVFRPFVDLFRD